MAALVKPVELLVEAAASSAKVKVEASAASSEELAEHVVESAVEIWFRQYLRCCYYLFASFCFTPSSPC